MLWIHASNPARFEQSVRDIADELKLPGRKQPKENVFELFRSWLRDERKGKWLVILDNADDTRFLLDRPAAGEGKQDGSQGSIGRPRLQDYLPEREHGSVLVTTRSKEAARLLVDEDEIMPIGTMERDDALALLKTKLGQKDKECSQDGKAETDELLAELEYMPLAITQAAAYIRQRGPRCTVGQYLDKLRKSNRSKESLLDLDSQNLRRDRDASSSIILTWQISFEHIRSIRESAADLLSLMSFLDRQAIPEFLLRGHRVNKENDEIEADVGGGYEKGEMGSDSSSTADDSSSVYESIDGFDEDLIVLQGYSFIALTTDTRTFEMHGLVQLATRKWLEAQGQVEQWKRQAICSLDTVSYTHLTLPTKRIV